MFDFNDLFQWERFITPQIIKIFYWLAVAVSFVTGIPIIWSGFVTLPIGIFGIFAGAITILAGIIFARIVAEFILIVFRISEHLGAIRQRGEM